MASFRTSLATILLISVIFGVFADNADSLITSLPGWDQTLPEMYSGTLQVTEFDKQHEYFYILVKAFDDPENKPLVVWLNGGPGCSSLIGFFKEIGPLQIFDNNNTISDFGNAFTWAEKANVLFLDAPVGTGFSSSKVKVDKYDDDSVADDIYDAINAFLVKYPEHSGKDIHGNPKGIILAGESYAGVIIPRVAEFMYKDENLHLTHIILGNPVINPGLMVSTVYEHLYGHQLYGAETHKIIRDVCSKDKTAPRCTYAKFKVFDMVKDMNQYNMKMRCYNNKHSSSGEYAPWWRIGLANEAGLQVGSKNCLDFEGMEEYLNREDVQAALHAPKGFWQACNSQVYSKYDRHSDGSTYKFQIFEKKSTQILIYSGDNDAVVPPTTTLEFLDETKLPLTSRWETWKVAGSQDFGGFTTKYGDNIRFATVRGAGHFAPKSKPAEVLDLVSQFLTGKLD